MESVWIEGKPEFSPIPTEESLRYDEEMNALHPREAWISKRCPLCKKVKPAWDFYYKPNKNKRSLNITETKNYIFGLKWQTEIKTRIPECRECHRKKWHTYTDDRKERLPANFHPDPSKTKKCLGCGKIKSLTEYYAKAGTHDGVTTRCKVCDRAKVRARYHATPIEKRKAKRRAAFAIAKMRRRQAPPEKKCKICGAIKPIKGFKKNTLSSDGYYHMCITCQTKKPDPSKFYRCTRCGEWKMPHDFRKCIGMKDGIESTCRACRNHMDSIQRARRDLRKIPLKYGFDYDKYFKEKDLQEKENLPN